jgi:hypothetical protein
MALGSLRGKILARGASLKGYVIIIYLILSIPAMRKTLFSWEYCQAIGSYGIISECDLFLGGRT